MRISRLTSSLRPLSLSLGALAAAAGIAHADPTQDAPWTGRTPLYAPDWTAMGLPVEPTGETEVVPETRDEPPPYFLAGRPQLPPAPVGAGVATRLNQTVHRDGSSAVTAAGALREWKGTEFGVDMSLAARRQGPTLAEPQPAAPAVEGASAWAKAPLPAVSTLTGFDRGTVDVRIDPLQEQSRLGTSLVREWSVGEAVSARFNDSYSFIADRTGGGQWETGKSVSVDLEHTGTTLSVGAAAQGGQSGWLPSVSASQRLLGPLVVTTSVTDTGDTLNRSVSAGFRRTW